MITPTPTDDATLPRRYADFSTLNEALDYAAKGLRGVNFYTARGELYDRCTYAQVRERAVDIGHRLIEAGFEKGDRLALIAETTSNFTCFFLGCQYAGVLPVPLPLPTSFGGREGYTQQLAMQLKSCAASGAVAPESMLHLLHEAADEFDLTFVGSPVEFMALNLGSNELREPDTDDIAYLQYSSGSTRFPHGVSVTHRSLMQNCFGMGYHGVGVGDGDRCVSWLPFYHDMGLVGTFLTTLACQVSVDFIATEDFARRPLQWLRIISENRGTITYSPTFGFDICTRRVKSAALAELDLSCLRVTGIGGDMIRPDVMRQFAETFAPAGFDASTYVPSYGMAETTLAVSFGDIGKGIEVDLVDELTLAGEAAGAPQTPLDQSINGHESLRYREIVNCGKPLPEYDIEIRDEDGTVLADKGIGIVFLRGISVMKEYFRDEEATKAVLSDDGWLDTGDMGYLLNGYLYLVGRIKDMIIINGKNHWPQDIEWAIEQLPGLRTGDIAAISVPGEAQEEVATVLVQCRKLDPELRQDLVQTIKQKVQSVTGMGVQVGLVPPRSLPRTSSGKLSRSKARRQLLAGAIVADFA